MFRASLGDVWLACGLWKRPTASRARGRRSRHLAVDAFQRLRVVFLAVTGVSQERCCIAASNSSCERLGVLSGALFSHLSSSYTPLRRTIVLIEVSPPQDAPARHWPETHLQTPRERDVPKRKRRLTREQEEPRIRRAAHPGPPDLRAHLTSLVKDTAETRGGATIPSAPPARRPLGPASHILEPAVTCGKAVPCDSVVEQEEPAGSVGLGGRRRARSVGSAGDRSPSLREQGRGSAGSG